MASLGADVTSVEIDPRLSAEAGPRLARAGLSSVRLEVGDGARGWSGERYDAIVLTGSTPVLPETVVAQIAPNGRLFAVVGDAPAMTARLVRRTAPDAVMTQDLFETVIAPLKNAAAPSRFRF
jgi:protein-L-isoaspartate(D-aspartate) O-methyltransferase